MDKLTTLKNYSGQYINYRPIKDEKYIDEFMKDKHYSNLKDYKLYIKKIMDYEKSRKHPSKNFAINLIIMLPGYLTKSDKHTIIKNFMNSISIAYKYKKIPYMYKFFKHAKGYYAELIIFEREVFVHKKDFITEETYIRDMRINKHTGKTTNKHDPDAILICKKGEAKRDEKGNRLVRANYVSKKLKYLSYKDSTSEDKKKSNFVRFIDRLKEKLINSMSKIIFFKPFKKLKSKQYSKKQTLPKRIKILNYNQRINDINYELIKLQQCLNTPKVIYDQDEAYKRFYNLFQSLAHITEAGECPISAKNNKYKVKINPAAHQNFKYLNDNLDLFKDIALRKIKKWYTDEFGTVNMYEI